MTSASASVTYDATVYADAVFLLRLSLKKKCE